MEEKQKISYCLWFNNEAENVAKFYTGIFKNSRLGKITYNPVDTPSGKTGTALTASFEIEGQPFLALNGGPEFTLNPSISFFINSNSPEEIDELWQKLSDGGKVLMELGKYPYSDKYGWVQDKYGLSWQLMLPMPETDTRPKLMPCLLLTNEVYGKAEEALQLYTSLFPVSKTGNIARYPAGMEPDKEGKIMYGDFMLAGIWFAIMESAREHKFEFNMALSFIVHCDTQEEVDHYWYKLTEEGGKEIQCGWLTDKFGISWQIVPRIMLQLLNSADKDKAKRAMEAMMKMVKLDIKTLEEAAG